MKKSIILCAVLLLSAGWSFAGNGTNVQTLISNKMKIPEQLKKQKLDEKVNVQFVIGQDGNISGIKVNTSNTELKNYIIQQFHSIDFKPAKEDKDQTYFIDLKFKVL